jgi:ParB-like chromosome segregation protein Spo0J
MSASTVTESRLPIASIIADDANQPRTDDLDEGYIKQLMEVPELWPPVKVVWLEGPQYLLVDGFHRYEAALRLELEELPATILPLPADGDLVALGFLLNAGHGRPLTRQDRARHVEHLLRRGPQQSDRLIAQRCGVSPATVGTIRNRLEQGAQIEHSAERVGADGRIYTQPERRPGELPDKPIAQLVGDGVKGLFDPQERRQMRDTARYLQRLLVALADSRNLPGWTSGPAIASACITTLGQEKAYQLACDLSGYVEELIEVMDTIAPPP